MSNKKTLGIVGGMGPLAAAEFFFQVVKATKAEKDQDHIHIIIDSDTNIPDRSQSIVAGDSKCVLPIKDSISRLIKCGAEVICMPCNTAHAFFEDIKEAAQGFPFLNMVEKTVESITKTTHKKVGLLATDGTVKSGVYQKECEKHGIEVLLPTIAGQKEVMNIIYDGVKAGQENYDTSKFTLELEYMAARGAGLFILGCTELPIAFKNYGIGFHYIDTAEVLAKEAVLACGYETI